MKPALSYRIIRGLNRVGLVTDARMDRIRNERGSADYRAASGIMRDILVKVVNESYEEQLRKLQCDAHLLWGDRDAEVPVAVAQAAADLLKESGHATPDIEVLDGVGHHVPMEAPGSLLRCVDSILE